MRKTPMLPKDEGLDRYRPILPAAAAASAVLLVLAFGGLFFGSPGQVRINRAPTAPAAATSRPTPPPTARPAPTAAPLPTRVIELLPPPPVEVAPIEAIAPVMEEPQAEEWHPPMSLPACAEWHAPLPYPEECP